MYLLSIYFLVEYLSYLKLQTAMKMSERERMRGGTGKEGRQREWEKEKERERRFQNQINISHYENNGFKIRLHYL